MNLMNKYTLRFKYKKLEDEYLTTMQNTVKIPIFKIGCVCIFIVTFYKMIQMLLDGDEKYLSLMIACQAFTIFSVIFLQLKLHKVNIQLMILSFLLVCYEMFIQADTSREALNLYSGNFTYCNIIIILISEYLDSLIILITSQSFRLIYTIIIDTQNSYSPYFATILLMLFLSYFSYKINQQSRVHFLLSQQDYMWEKKFPKLIDKPYLIFQFNEEKIEFLLKSSHNLAFDCTGNSQLKHFLREWKSQQNSIELILFQSLMDQSTSDIVQQTIDVYNGKKEKLCIKFTILKALSSCIILTIEDQFIKQKELQDQVSKIQLRQEKIFYSFVKFTYNNLLVSLQNFNKYKLFATRNTLYLTILNFKINRFQQKIQVFDSRCLGELQELFNYKNISININEKKDGLQLFVQAYLERLVFEVCKNSFSNSQIDLTFGEVCMIQYYGKFINFSKNPSLEQVWNSLVDKFHRTDYKITIYINNEQNIRFRNQKQF